MSNIPKRNIASGRYLLRRNWSAFLRTTRCNYIRIPQIMGISFRHWVPYILLWKFEEPKIFWRYTVNLYSKKKKKGLLWAMYLKEISLLANIFEKKMVSFCNGLLDVTTNVYPESCTCHPDTVCRTLWRGNLNSVIIWKVFLAKSGRILTSAESDLKVIIYWQRPLSIWSERLVINTNVSLCCTNNHFF